MISYVQICETNFVGACNELQATLKEMIQHERVNKWIDFKMNVPHANPRGGIWEMANKHFEICLYLPNLFCSNFRWDEARDKILMKEV